MMAKVPKMMGQFLDQLVKPFERLKPSGQHISHTAARRRYIHAMRVEWRKLDADSIILS